MARPRMPTIYVVSDGRGDTGTRLVKAALVQFEGQKYRLIRKANVRTAEKAREIVAKAAESRAVVFYTLVAEETRRAMKRASGEFLIPTLDLLGPGFAALHDLFHVDRQATPGLLYASEREQIDRYDAIDYTLKHDDGQRPQELGRADVVLVGVSRASKSSTCFYLAYAGVRAANIPLIPDIPPPAQLTKLDPAKVVGLRVNVHRLITVREHRVMKMGVGALDQYLDKREIAREVLHANRTMETHGWRSFDVSYLAIEEIAKQVLTLRGFRR